MWTLAHSNLQKACIYLFPEERDCRVLVSDSGMDASQINFADPPALRWQSVIDQAEKQNVMEKLIPVLLARYPENEQLKAACKPFEASEPIRAIPIAKKTKLVPLVVPKELASIAANDAVATIASLRITIIELYKKVAELENWRMTISAMSSSDIAVKGE